jgi:hypothetical protein
VYEGAYYQSESHSAHCNESGAESNKCGAVPTVDSTLFPAGRKPPPTNPAVTRATMGKTAIPLIRSDRNSG